MILLLLELILFETYTEKVYAILQTPLGVITMTRALIEMGSVLILATISIATALLVSEVNGVSKVSNFRFNI